MSIDVTTLEDESEWNDYVERSPQGTPIHRYEALECIARETGSKLHTLAGFKGQEPVGVLPLFEQSQGPFTTVRSPPKLELFTLGPARLNFGKLKQRKAERRHRRVVDGWLDWLDDRLDPDYVDVRTVAGYPDVRPFKWRGLDVSPSYTYVVDLDTDRESLLERFSRDARSNIRDGTGRDGVTVREAGGDAIGRIVAQVRSRYADFDEPYPVSVSFAEQLYERLPEGTMRAYTVEQDGEFVSGMVTYEGDGTVYRWQGGVTADSDLPVTELLDWHIMTDAMERGHAQYDLVGANMPRLCDYKAKFDPEAVEYYVARRRTDRMKATMQVYHALPDRLQVL